MISGHQKVWHCIGRVLASVTLLFAPGTGRPGAGVALLTLFGKPNAIVLQSVCSTQMLTVPSIVL